MMYYMDHVTDLTTGDAFHCMAGDYQVDHTAPTQGGLTVFTTQGEELFFAHTAMIKIEHT